MTEPATTIGYGNRKIRQDFDDLAAGVWVEIKNPSMLPEDALSPDRDMTKIKDKRERQRVVNGWIASFIVDWHVYDLEDYSDDPAILGDPCAEAISRCPSVITNWIALQIRSAADPS